MTDCPVCYEALANRLGVFMPCSSGVSPHILCMQCFIHLRTRECPLCRTGFEHAIPPIEEDTRENLIEFLRATNER